MTGIVPILVTPFDDEGGIDEASLRQLVEFNVAAGVHGIGVANGSELFKMSEAERALIVGCVIDAVKGRVPVVVSTGAAGTDVTIGFSRAAEKAGADMVMITPPGFMPVQPDGIVEHYRRVSQAVSVPVCLQDVPAGPVAAPLALRIATECPRVTHIKVETEPLAQRMSAMVAAASHLLTILGGAGGTYFIEEMRRGSQGTMPYCSQPEVFVEVWNRFRSGDEAGARALFDSRILALNKLSKQGNDTQHHIHKQLLVRLGVIRRATVRGPTVPPDAITQKEIDAQLEELVPAARPFGG
jgi:4-hydroxy-tetrahydrodipicolinate synthase